MKRKYLILLSALLLLLVMTKGLAAFKYASIEWHTRLTGLDIIKIEDRPPRIWVEVHDVSPGYGLDKLREITRIIDGHESVVEKKVLFVIPNHGGSTPISAYPEFAKALRKLSDKGYVIGAHGYTHEGGMITPEFRTNSSTARNLIQSGDREFEEAGLPLPTHFSPPGWQASSEASHILRERFDYIYYAFYIDTHNGTLPYSTNEYTWYNVKLGGLEKAKKDYRRSKGIFRLTIHINAANTRENLELLDQFLSWGEER